MKTPEKFEVECHDHVSLRFSVGWRDTKNRYHVWLDGDRAPVTPWSMKPPIIYVNTLSTEKSRLHRPSRRSLASHPKIATAIASIPAEEFEAAIRLAVEKEDARKAKAHAENIERLREEARLAGFDLVPIGGQK